MESFPPPASTGSGRTCATARSRSSPNAGTFRRWSSARWCSPGCAASWRSCRRRRRRSAELSPVRTAWHALSVQSFTPPRWLRGRHAQTMFGTLLRRGPRLPLRRERWELSDGDYLDVDRLEGPPDAPLLVVLHGLEGSSSSHYVRGLLAQARTRGWRGMALNFRSCSGEPNRLLRSYHSGETGDLGEAVRRARAESDSAPLLLAGCSLGGNVLVKWLGEQGASAPVHAAAALSVPFDLKVCARALDAPGAMSFVYR